MFRPSKPTLGMFRFSQSIFDMFGIFRPKCSLCSNLKPYNRQGHFQLIPIKINSGSINFILILLYEKFIVQKNGGKIYRRNFCPYFIKLLSDCLDSLKLLSQLLIRACNCLFLSCYFFVSETK